MKKISGIWFAAMMFLGTHAFAAELATKTFLYGPNQQFEGYLASPAGATGKTPALLVVHNWMGLTDETKKQVGRLAELGYVVMAADIYGKGDRPKDQAEAGKFAGKYKGNRKLFRERLNLALNRLKEEKNVNPDKIAAVGYCFGGTGALELARSGAPLLGIVSFHGGLDSPNPEDGKNIKGKVLALHGAIDPFVSPQDIAAFEKEMQNNKVDYQLVRYSGTVHSFTDVGAGSDPSKGQAYNPTSDRRSFAAAKNFLAEIFN